MKITFLGTGAADWPLEKPAGAAEFRRLSSALIDDTLLIDPGPQVFEALRDTAKDPAAIRYILNTHRHSDHYCAETVSRLEATGAELTLLHDGEVATLGRYTVYAYRANHSTAETVHFIITDGEKTLFYGLDGAWLLYGEIQAIKQQKPDLAVLDATIGYAEGDYRVFEHNNLRMVTEMKRSLESDVGQFCISHMARTLHTDHRTLADAMREHGILVAYDGWETEI